MNSWRLIVTAPASGSFNMALDEAMLCSLKSKPSIRFYSWDPPSISTGRNQNPEKLLDIRKCNESGVGIVRRITGGGIIYHTEELTYSIVCRPSDIPDAVSVKDSFRVLTSFLLDAYKKLGLEPEYACRSKAGNIHPADFCFAGHESCDILIRGRKIGGNAQKRLKDRLILHGSIPLRNMAAAGASYLLSPPEEISSATTSLSDEGISITADELINTLSESFSRCMGVKLEKSGLSEAEKELAGRLEKEKYRNQSWNFEGEAVKV